MNTTIGEWYNTIQDEDIRSRAILNTQKQDKSFTTMVHSMYEAINQGIRWASTNEGYEYWKEIAHRSKKEQI